MSTDDTGSTGDEATTGKTDAEKKVDTAKPGSDPDVAGKGAGPRAAEPASTGRKSSNTPVILAAVAGVVAVAAATTAVIFGLQSSQRGDDLDAVNAATTAACDFGREVSTYDYSRNLDEYFQKVKDGSTGDFLKEFGDAQQALTDAMVQAQVKSWAEDVQCGYQNGDDTEARVLVTLTQYRTNFTQPTPSLQYVVITADLEKSGDKWLVSTLDSPMLNGSGTGLPGGAGAPAPAPGAETPAPEAPQPQPGG